MKNDPWVPSTGTAVVTASANVAVSQAIPADPFSAWEQQLEQTNNSDVASSSTPVSSSTTTAARKTPENFLGENSNLVNLDNLLGVSSTANSNCVNPFLLGSSSMANPFASQQRKSPTLNEMRAAQASVVPPVPQIGPRVGTLPAPVHTTNGPNPFVSQF
ncbi:unnamed protein product [Angiostrongylus costaricensis]|uniref:Clathrin assembly protein n=1 Tax=Angiostrongylus costaricensis TaxID=334426 RepID=A0A0R3PZ66_ANGCS|nr:unnamed protein product [Angiostrongylus costaricensis]